MKAGQGGGAAARWTDWTDEEPPLRIGRRLRHLLGRAAPRPRVPLAATAIAVALVLLVSALRPDRFQSTVVLSITEPDLAPEGAARVYRRLRTHVKDVLLSRERLLAVIRARGLYPKLLARSPERAVAALREDLDVVVWRNYFLEERDPDSEAPRTARLSITCSAATAEVAQAVVSDLGEAAVASALAARVSVARSTLLRLEGAIAERRADLEVRRSAQVRTDLANRGQPSGPQRLAAADRAAVAESLAGSLSALEDAWALQDRELRQEQLRLGLRFERVDAGGPPATRDSRMGERALGGVVLFALLLPLSFLAAGAFDRRVRSLEDVEALGLVAITRVPPAPRS